jgi:hypothetical protein
LNQEFKSTISYLSRLGYDPDDGLDVFVIANPAPGEALKAIFDEDCNLHVLGASEAAKILGLQIGPQADERYADVLHVGWAGRKGRFILPMKVAQVDKVSKPRQAATIAGLFLFAGASFLGFQTVSKLGTLSEINSSIQLSKRQKSQLDSQYQRETQRLQDVGFDARLVQSSLAVYEELETDRIRVLDLYKGVGKALGKDLRVDSIEVERSRPGVIGRAWNAVKNEKGSPLFEARLKMTYPSTADIDRGNKEVSDLRGRIETVLPAHKVEVTKFLKDYEYTEGLVVEAGDLEQQNVQQDFVAEILIKGPVPK